jgi:nicotinate phosphoribosyltransferase
MSDQAIDAIATIAASDAMAPLLAPPNTPGTPIIRSLLETDFYKFNMWQLLWRRHPGLHASYRFCCRNTPAYPLAELLPALNTELDALCALRFRPTELAWLAEHSPLRPAFLAWLRGFGFERRHIRAWAEAGQLHIEASGPQPQVMGFEIYVLAIVSELYFRRWLAQQPGGAARALPALLAQGRARLQDKIAQLQALAVQPAPAGAGGFALFDFGLRRRFSAAWQQEVVATLQAQLPGVFKGTSSVLLAQELGLAPIGTMAHEYLQTYQALPGPLRDFQRRALEDWWDEFGPPLAVALTDVVGMDAFLADFGPTLAQHYQGLRHDSGDPVAWAEKALAHYARLGLDARSKRLVFSDGLSTRSAIALYQRFATRAQLGFGIGTHLTNDLGVAPLNIVMKLMRINGQAVAKLSDAPGKTLCDDPAFLQQLREAFLA